MGVLKQTGANQGFVLGSHCLLGRQRTCDVRLDNPRVSSEHARLDWAGDHWELKDLGSTNGTFVAGRRLLPGARAVLAQGVVFTLGTADEFVLEDATPPVVSARNLATGQIRAASNGILILPDDKDPEVNVIEDADGHWVVEDSDDNTRKVSDGERINLSSGEVWELDLPSTSTATVQAGAAQLTLETIKLTFAVSRDEETIVLTLVHDGGSIVVEERSHHYVMLTLARAYLEDEDSSPAERGWVNRETLCKELGMDARRLNVDVFRARKQFAELEVNGAASIIARRPGSGQLRLGVQRVTVNRL